MKHIRFFLRDRICLLLFLLSSQLVYGQYNNTFVVVKNTDPNPFLSLTDPQMVGTLQWAIKSANAASGSSQILFAIPGPSPQTINMVYNLPRIVKPVKLDAKTGNIGDYPIIINGGGNVYDGFEFWPGSSGSIVTGFFIREFSIAGVMAYGNNTPIKIDVLNNKFLNVAYYNQGATAAIRLEGTQNCVIKGNYIGTDNISSNIGNQLTDGISTFYYQNIRNIIGSTQPGEQNVISYCQIDGIAIANALYNKMSGNIFFGNVRNGIEMWYWLSGSPDPRNNLKPFPLIQAHTTGSAGTLSGTAAPNDIVEVFKSTGPQTAITYLKTVTADAAGKWTVTGISVSSGDKFVSTATDKPSEAGQNTSELSNVYTVPNCSVDASFTYSSNPRQGTPVQFTPNSIVSGYQYSWKFGDGGTSNQTSPTYTYASAGSYTVTLTVTGGGCSNTSTNGIRVGVNCPVADFEPSEYCNSMHFSWRTTGGGGYNGNTYSWAFGDGATSSQVEPDHVYAATGTYDVTLTVRYSDCAPSVIVKPVYFIKAGSFSYTPPSPVLTGTTVNFSTPDASLGGTYAWSFGDVGTATGSAPTHVYTVPGTYTITYTVSFYRHVSAPCVYTSTQSIVVQSNDVTIPIPNCCQFTGLNKSGAFYMDEDRGTLVYKQTPSSTSTLTFPCFSGNGLDKVVSANATVFADNWVEGNTADPYPFESGEKGKWRPKEQYVYREVLNQQGENKNYTEGKFALAMFNWTQTTANSPQKWVKTTTTNKFSRNAQPLEDQNIINIRSTAKYGYNNTLSVLVAQNAADHTVAFEGFESVYGSGGAQTLEDNLPYTPSTGTVVFKDILSTPTYKVHTGSGSVKMIQNKYFLVGKINAANLALTGQQSVVVRVWLSNDKNIPSLDGKVSVAQSSSTYGTNAFPMNKISDAGDWSLYEAIISKNIPVTGDISYSIAVNEQNVFMDDARIQPIQSEMVCYVYDKVQRLVAVMDDQHYAMIYEYNAEGILIRKLKETTEGIKTISETQYNTKGVNR